MDWDEGGEGEGATRFMCDSVMEWIGLEWSEMGWNESLK